MTSHPHLFYWHTWPDEPLIHGNAQKDDALRLVAAQTKQQLSSAEFWPFIDRIRQGRRLVITSDHGYADSHFFSDEVRDSETVQLLRNAFGAKRYAVESPNTPWPRRHFRRWSSISGRLAVHRTTEMGCPGRVPALVSRRPFAA